MRTITLPILLPTLNEYILQCRAHAFAGASLKKKAQALIAQYIANQKSIDIPKGYKLKVSIKWVRDNKRIDPDNIAFAKKFILDAFTCAKIIPNDSFKYIGAFEDSFDTGDPRIEITLSLYKYEP